MDAGQEFSNLPGWARGVISLVAVGGAAFVGYKIYMNVQRAAELAKAKEEEQTVKDEIAALAKKGIKSTIAKSQLQDMANQLKTAFDGYGTDVDTIYRVMAKVKNDVDLLNLKKEFGVRKISSGRYSPEPDKEGTLGEIMSAELSAREINNVNLSLAKSGIKGRF